MIENQAETLSEYGIDYTGAMDRFAGNEALYVRLATKFLDDQHFEAFENAMANSDFEQAQREVHSLKGVAGNLSFANLYSSACLVNDALRNNDLETVEELLPTMKTARAQVLEALQLLQQ